MSPIFRVAFVQGRPSFGRTDENLERGLALAENVGADLVVLPELWSTGYVFSTLAEVAALAEDPENGAATFEPRSSASPCWTTRWCISNSPSSRPRSKRCVA